MAELRPVHDGLDKLLRLQGHATPSEVARVSGVPFRKVVDVLLDNVAVLQKDERGRIVGIDLHSAARRVADQAYAEGRTYTVHEINYGYDRAIAFHGNDELGRRLARPYTHGGLGDSYTRDEILASDENLAAVQAAGLQPYEAAWPDEASLWKE